MIVQRLIARHRYNVALYAALLMPASFSSLVRAEEQPMRWEESKAQALNAWKEYLQFARRLQGTVSVVREDGPGQKKRTSQTAWDFKQRERCGLKVRRDLLPKQGSAQAWGINPQYAFELERQSQERGWALTSLRNSPGEGESAGQSNKDATLDKQIVRSIAKNLVIHNLWLPELVDSSDFRVIGLPRQVGDRPLRLRVEFEHLPKVILNNPVRHGWMILDVNHHWLLDEYEVQMLYKDGATVQKAKFYSKQDTNGFLIPQRIVLTTTNREGTIDFEYRQDFDLREEQSPQIAEFTLSAFGLPEPRGVEWKTGTAWWIWCVGAAVAFSVLAAVFRWLKLRVA